MQVATDADPLLQKTSVTTDFQQCLETCTTQTSTEISDSSRNSTISDVSETKETSVDFLLKTISVTARGEETSWFELTISPGQSYTESTAVVTSQYEEEAPATSQASPASIPSKACGESLLRPESFEGPSFSWEDGARWGKKPKKDPSGQKKYLKK